MANSITFSEYADYVKLDVVSDIDGFTVWKSFCANVVYADKLYTAPAGVFASTVEDRSLLLGTVYYYWLISGGTSQLGPLSSQLRQYKLYGRRGRKKKSFDYDVECPLCGFKCRRTKLRKGYIKPFISGNNYLPNAAAPENWTWVNGPFYYDANVYEFYLLSSISRAHVFPSIEKNLHERYVGVPVLQTQSTDTPHSFYIGTPLAGGTGRCVYWVYPFSQDSTKSYSIQVEQEGGGFTSQSTMLTSYSPGWHKIITDEITWVSGQKVLVTQPLGNFSVAVGFGGMILTTANNPELSTIPDRETALGDYTTGGMMDLCPDCYSGLRRRVPWE